MKTTAGSLCLVILLLSPAGTLSAQERRDSHHSGPPSQTVEARLDLQDDADRGVLTLRIGPFDLPAGSGHGELPQAPPMFLSVPFDGWFTAYRPRLVDGAGRTLPGRLLHHVAFWHTGRPDFLCPNKPEHVFGAGGEMNEWPAVPGYGYRVDRGDILRIDTMFHNPTASGFTGVHLEVAIEYRRAGGDGQPLVNYYPAWFDVQECGESSYDLRAGENVTSGKIRMPGAGTLLGVGGHLHDFGRRLVLENVTRNGTIAVLEAVRDETGRLVSIPVADFIDRGGYRLEAGEVVRVTATYDNRTGGPLPAGAMGMVVGYFVPDDDRALARP